MHQATHIVFRQASTTFYALDIDPFQLMCSSLEDLYRVTCQVKNAFHVETGSQK